MLNLRKLYEIKVVDYKGNYLLSGDSIVDEISDAICSWDYGNANEDTTQWHSCAYNGIGLVAVNAPTSLNRAEMADNIISILEDHDIDIDDISIECVSYDINIVDNRVATLAYDYSGVIEDEYRKILLKKDADVRFKFKDDMSYEEKRRMFNELCSEFSDKRIKAIDTTIHFENFEVENCSRELKNEIIIFCEGNVFDY